MAKRRGDTCRGWDEKRNSFRGQRWTGGDGERRGRENTDHEHAYTCRMPRGGMVEGEQCTCRDTDS